MQAPSLQPNGYYWNPPDAEWLEYHYVHLDKTGREIAAEVGCTRPTVIAWLRKVGIPVRPATYRPDRGTSPDWARNKGREVLLASGVPYACVHCKGARGGTGRLDCHHRDEDPFNNDLENLVWLCRSCHEELHKTYLSEGGDANDAVVAVSG